MTGFRYVIPIIAQLRLDYLRDGRLDDNHELQQLGFSAGIAGAVMREMDRIEHGTDVPLDTEPAGVPPTRPVPSDYEPGDDGTAAVLVTITSSAVAS